EVHQDRRSKQNVQLAAICDFDQRRDWVQVGPSQSARYAMAHRQRLGECKVAEGTSRERQHSCSKSGRMDADSAEHASDGRSYDEAKPERGADEAEALRTILGWRDVGNVSLRSRDVAAREAVEQAREEHHGQGSGEAEQEVARRRSENAQQKNGTA